MFLFSRVKAMALVLALSLAVITAHKVKALGSPDFKVFYTAARFALTAPEKMYIVSPDRFLYPPSAAILLAPFGAAENFATAQWAWHGLLAFLVFALASTSGAALAAMALLIRYLTITFAYGQINLVVIAILACADYWRRRRPALAGSLWMLASTLKIYPLVYAPAFFPKGARKGIIAGVGAGLLIVALPFLIYGPALGIDLYHQFFASLGSKGMPLHSHNQSVAALLYRLFTDNWFYLHAVGNAQWTLVALSEHFVRWAAFEIGLIVAVVSWWKVLKEKNREPLSAAAFCILFLSHIVWKDYFLWLYFPLRELFGILPRRQAWALAAGYVAIVTLSSPDLLGAAMGARLDAACIHLWGAVLVWVTWIRKK